MYSSNTVNYVSLDLRGKNTKPDIIMTTFQLISTKYRNSPSGPIVTMYGRSDSGKAIQQDFRGLKPYFFIQPKNFDNVKLKLSEFPEVTEVFEEYRFLPNGYQEHPTEVLQVYVSRPNDVPKIRDSLKGDPDIVEVFEADVLFATQRFLTNYGLHGMGWVECDNDYTIKPLERVNDSPIKILGFDIEVLPPEKGVPVPEKHPIIIISVSFNDQESIVLSAKSGVDQQSIKYLGSENNVLKTFLEIIKNYDPDIIMGFNEFNFDFPYIERRLSILGIPNDIGRDGSPFQLREFGNSKETTIIGRACIDLLSAIKLNYSLASYSLDSVSKNLLNRPKLDVKASEMREIWLGNDPEKLDAFHEYAKRDADLLQDIIKELKLIDRYIAISKECGLLLHETINGGQSRRIESMLLREFYKENRLWPLNDKSKKVLTKVEGATVFEPDRGLHENIIVMDYKSLYPSAIRAYNICWSSIINDENSGVQCVQTPNNVCYTKHSVYEGIMPRILTRLYNKRVELKTLMKSATNDAERTFYDNQQYSVKILLNSFYGYTGAVMGRLYDPRLANSVTAVGRRSIALTKETAEKLVDCRVVGGDTDSLFIKLNTVDNPDDGLKASKIIHDEMLKILPPPMEIDFECFCKRAIIFEKKRYAMWIFEPSKTGWKDKMKYRGLELRRRDWVQLVGETMDKVFHLILQEGKVQEAWQYTNEILLQVKNLKDIRLNEELANKLVLSRKISDIDKYKNVQPHVTVYNKMKDRGEQLPGLGDRLSYMALPGASKGSISLLVDTPDYIRTTDGRIDTTWYIDAQIKPPLQRIFNAINIDIDTGKQKLKEVSLFTFGSEPKTINNSNNIVKKDKIEQPSRRSGLFAFQ